MSEYCVVVAEGARARFFTLEPAAVPELESGPNLQEHNSLANPSHKAHQNKIFADTRSGRNRSTVAGAHGYDEHRSQHDDEMEHRFARDIANELSNLTSANGTRRVVLCAEKRMLGFLRGALNGSIPNGVEVVEVAKDLAKLPARSLHERLAGQGLLPARRARNAAG
ncbi:MAG: host attachment protein [Ectothiorhodospiraceae bacterium]|jgi:protein required for attachment to host cells